MSWVDRLLAFLERVAPWFLLGFRAGQEEGQELKKENTNLKMQLKEKENVEAVKSHNASISDELMVDEILQSVGKPKRVADTDEK